MSVHWIAFIAETVLFGWRESISLIEEIAAVILKVLCLRAWTSDEWLQKQQSFCGVILSVYFASAFIAIHFKQ